MSHFSKRTHNVVPHYHVTPRHPTSWGINLSTRIKQPLPWPGLGFSLVNRSSPDVVFGFTSKYYIQVTEPGSKKRETITQSHTPVSDSDSDSDSDTRSQCQTQSVTVSLQNWFLNFGALPLLVQFFNTT